MICQMPSEIFAHGLVLALFVVVAWDVIKIIVFKTIFAVKGWLRGS